ncbi:DUF202 domain-containing protein [Geodermatophilus ruber]|uniref:Putative membrane protein n=1 Tax=Geodermatophilus ruber TaxID=504800 RepID=A0A1I4D2P8_9ACTN|nr:DUF202 domain-containing protein [Geodermatophilus ruber]SFK87009.1 putative membrane protein [Geodermatophilus ruber]
MSRAARETWQERTALAWQRTGLGVLAVAGLMAHHSAQGGAPVLLALAGVVALLGLAVLGWLAPRRERLVHRAVESGSEVAAPRLALLATVVVALVAVAALATVLTPA